MGTRRRTNRCRCVLVRGAPWFIFNPFYHKLSRKLFPLPRLPALLPGSQRFSPAHACVCTTSPPHPRRPRGGKPRRCCPPPPHSLLRCFCCGTHAWLPLRTPGYTCWSRRAGPIASLSREFGRELRAVERISGVCPAQLAAQHSNEVHLERTESSRHRPPHLSTSVY